MKEELETLLRVSGNKVRNGEDLINQLKAMHQKKQEAVIFDKFGRDQKDDSNKRNGKLTRGSGILSSDRSIDKKLDSEEERDKFDEGDKDKDVTLSEIRDILQKVNKRMISKMK